MIKNVMDTFNIEGLVYGMVNGYDDVYFKSSTQYINTYSLFLKNYITFVKKVNNTNLIDFLTYSVNSNNCISDRLENKSFTVRDNIVSISLYNENREYTVMGILTIGDYILYTNNSNIFIINNKTKIQYFYYGD